MARSSGAVPQPNEFATQTFGSPGGAVSYTVGKLFIAKVGDIQVSRPLEFFIGSGAIGRSYLTSVDRYLFQAPVSYYSSDSTWRVSPGFERSETLNVSRPVEVSCLNCHASGVRLVAGTVNRYEDSPFREGGVGCERCHGSGEEHVQLKTRGTILNPAKLAADARDSICAQCHLSGEVRVAKTGQAMAFKPGEILNKASAVFMWEPPRSRQVNGHVEELARSRCKLASGDKLWCGSCHDPHTEPVDKAAWYRERCFACHNNKSCGAPPATRRAQQDNCVACHMPRSAVRDVQHAAYTNHSIPKRTITPPVNTVPELVAFQEQASDRDLAIATALVALRENNQKLGLQAFNLLKAAWQQDRSDSAAGSQLAQLYDRMGQEQNACDIYQLIAKNTVPPPAALNNWGTCLAKEGRVSDSIPFWQRVTEISPAEESAWINLAVAQIQTKQLASGRLTLEKALRFHPTSTKARDLLRNLLASPSERF